MALSRRAQAIAEAATELNPFDILRNIRSETNPNGYISLGVAENARSLQVVDLLAVVD